LWVGLGEAGSTGQYDKGDDGCNEGSYEHLEGLRLKFGEGLAEHVEEDEGSGHKQLGGNYGVNFGDKFFACVGVEVTLCLCSSLASDLDSGLSLVLEHLHLV
jgi:hypothetical protein